MHTSCDDNSESTHMPLFNVYDTELPLVWKIWKPGIVGELNLVRKKLEKGGSQENVRETYDAWKIAQVEPHYLGQTVF